MRRFLVLAAAVLLVGVLTASSAPAQLRSETSTWRITIANLTPHGPGAPGSQPLSPPLFVVHSTNVSVWSVGTIATHGVAAIAEDANNAPLEQALPQLEGVATVFTGAGGPIPSGATRTYTVEAAGGDAGRLSIVTMLVNTNDAFTGLDSLPLTDHRQRLSKIAYDAGSEKNNELKAFIPGPCCGNPFVRDPEGKLIAPHPGITGTGDLSPALYGWTGAVARISIERSS